MRGSLRGVEVGGWGDGRGQEIGAAREGRRWGLFKEHEMGAGVGACIGEMVEGH